MNYDHKVKCTQLQVDDLVPLKRMAYKRKHKIKDHWEKTFYKDEGQAYSGMPAFIISSVDGDGEVKIVHHNLLLPIGTDIEASGNEVNQQDVDRQWVVRQHETVMKCLQNEGKHPSYHY